jgi:hypothetical protein
MLLESIVATLLLAAALVGVSQLLIVAGRDQRAVELRRVAAREAGNILEEIAARPFEQVTPETLAGYELSAESRQQLPEGRVSVRVESAQEPVAARQVQVEVGWRNLSGRDERLQLTAWRFGQREP